MSTSTLSIILDQLEKVRWRLFKSLAPICVLFVVGYLFIPNMFEMFVAPLRDRLAPGENLIGTGVAEVFFVELKVAFVAAVVAGSPFVFYQIGCLIAPVFDEANNRRYLIGFVATTSFCFLLGAFFCYRSVLPVAFLYFLDQYGSLGLTPQIRVSEYFSFFLRITVAFGLTFELPIFTFFLVRLGVWNYLLLWRQFRYAIVVIFVLAAVLTPPDVVSQVLLAGPLIVLYLISIGIAYIFRRARGGDGAEKDD